MEDEAVQAEFSRWLEGFKRTLPGGTTIHVFLTTEYLRQAFMAGATAARKGENGDCPAR
jgi:hypothetical protein